MGKDVSDLAAGLEAAFKEFGAKLAPTIEQAEAVVAALGRLNEQAVALQGRIATLRQAALDRVTPVAQPWHRRFFKGGRAPYSGRPYSRGFTFLNSGDGDYDLWKRVMGDIGDVVSGQLAGGGGAATRIGDWEQVIGGSIAKGAGYVQPGSQMDLAKADHLLTWLKTYPKDVWGVICLATMPRGWTVDLARSIADGGKDDDIALMGERFRRQIESYGRDPEAIALRFDHESNQDTMLNPCWYKQGLDVPLRVRFTTRWLKAFRKGYGYDLPAILSLAATPVVGPLRDLLGDGSLYQAIDLSWHPAKGRADTPEQLQQFMQGGLKNHYSWGGDVLPLLKEDPNLSLAVLEAACRHEAPPLEGSVDMVGKAPLYAEAVDALADLLEQHADRVAFLCLHSDRQLNRNLWMQADPKGKGPIWQRMHDRVVARFGKAT